MPVKPSYVKFAKGTPSARFLKFCKVGTRGNYCKKMARKNTLAPMPWDQGKLLQKNGQKKHPGANAIMS